MFQKKKSGLAIQASTVALTTARAITSHLRRLYARRYHGRFRSAPWVFGFDLALVGLAAALIGINIFLLQASPSPQPGIGLVLSAPPIISGAPLAFEARIISRDNREHRDVTLSWDLPANTQILSASPQLTAQQEVFLGTLKPGQEITAHLVARLFVPPGSVSLGFRIRDQFGHLAGSEMRPVKSSGLHLEPLVRPTAMVPGAFIPFMLNNETSQPFEAVEILAGGSATIEGKTRLALGTLLPFEQRVFFVKPEGGSLFDLQARSRGVTLSAASLALQESHEPFPVTNLTLPPSTPGQETVVEVQSLAPAQLLVFHPALNDAKNGARMFDIAVGTQKIPLPLDPAYVDPIDRWFAVPLVSKDDQITIGRTVTSIVTTPFGLTAQARYYAATGDQLGVGPLPPRVGQTTKYWVSWKLGPTNSDLSNLEIRATLPPGVRLTGREALPQGGGIVQKDNEVVWNLAYLPATSGGMQISFEVALTPSPAMRGTVPLLLGPSSASAFENRTQIVVHSSAGGVDTALPDDNRAAGRGTVGR